MAAIIPQKTKNAIHNVKMTIRYENGRIMTSKFNISTIIENVGILYGYNLHLALQTDSRTRCCLDDGGTVSTFKRWGCVPPPSLQPVHSRCRVSADEAPIPMCSVIWLHRARGSVSPDEIGASAHR